MRSALTVASGFPLTKAVKVSSLSADRRREPNHERFVSSGDDSGVKWTSSDDALKKKRAFVEKNIFM